MGPRASPRALRPAWSPLPLPSTGPSPPSASTTAVGEDLMKVNPAERPPPKKNPPETQHGAHTGDQLSRPCISSTRLCSSRPELAQPPQAETSPPLRAAAPAAPSTSAARAPSPWEILRHWRAVPSSLSLCDPLGRRGVPPAPVQSLWSNADSPPLGVRTTWGGVPCSLWSPGPCPREVPCDGRGGSGPDSSQAGSNPGSPTR